MGAGRLRQRPDGSVVLPLAGRAVGRVEADPAQLRLHFDDGALIAIGGELVLRCDGRPVGASRLVAQTVSGAWAVAGGALRVTFVGGPVLAVAADPAYEAWDAVGPGPGIDAWRIVSMPSGEFAIWS